VVDNDLFGRTFFPKAIRQTTPAFHREIDHLLNDPRARFLSLACYRDSAKTTKLRVFTAKRIGYNLSRTILYVGASESHAARSIQWIRSAIEPKRGSGGLLVPSLYAQVFGLRPGKKWTDTELEIFHGTDEKPIWVLGVGITGNIRGINFDDYRPDLIILDDILTDENGATEEQRNKVTSLVTGALKDSLAPASEMPNAKLAMLSTPQHSDDVMHRAEKDPEWVCRRFSCWTKETQNLEVEQQVSSWEERFPTPVRRKEKLDATAANRLSTFTKEKEVRITAPELAMFRPEWLRFYSEPPREGYTVLAIDPVPPPDEKAVRSGKVFKNDFEVHMVWRKYGDNFFLLEYDFQRGHTPTWSIAKFIYFASKYNLNKIRVEGVAYQKTLKWIFEQEMKKLQRWWVVDNTPADMRSKPVRINSILAGPAAAGHIHVRPEHSHIIQQWQDYPNCEHDDFIDCAAMGVQACSVTWAAADGSPSTNVVPMRVRRLCP
jgi:hypothetical protein